MKIRILASFVSRPCRPSCQNSSARRQRSSRLHTDVENVIRSHTRVTRDHITPEIALHLITKDCPLWAARVDENIPFLDPFWAFYWPGGQVLTRFVLDHPGLFQGHTVLDVGSGCGASAIAVAMTGADRVIANDVDPYASCAIEMNARENDVTVNVDSNNLIGQFNSEWSTIILGDMFYDCDFRDDLILWLDKQCRRFQTRVFIGDPGRLPLTESIFRQRLEKVAEYKLPETSVKENNGMTRGYVWKLNIH